MSEEKSKDIKSIREMWDKHAETYDEWYKTFEGAAEHYVDWEILRKYLPEDRDATILDVAGGTGRITLPLAKMGFSVTLCDISPKMLDVARQKMIREGVSNRVNISECDFCNLPLPDEIFDFVLCWDGMIEAAEELARVTKHGGTISVYLMNKLSTAIDDFFKDSDYALALIESIPSYVHHDREKHRPVCAEEARSLFGEVGIRVIDIYAVCGWMNVLPIPKEVRESHGWDENFFRQATEMVLRLSKEPSVSGMSRHLALYGKKI